jgi:phage tail protein X
MSKSIKSTSLLDNIIKFLIILLLLGALFVISIFAKEKLKSKDSIKQVEIKEKVIETKPVITSTNETQNKVYSQDEMQEIVQMMMDQMQELNKSSDIESTKLSIDETDSQNDSQLLATLQNADIEDDIETQQDTNVQEIKADESKDKVDHYNKVVINDSKYSEKNLNALTQKIGSIVEDMSAHKTTQTTYTQNISKEVTTRVDEMRVIRVKRGDTLSKIALRAYGRVSGFHKIVEANKDLIKNPNHIYVGQRLRVPTL